MQVLLNLTFVDKQSCSNICTTVRGVVDCSILQAASLIPPNEIPPQAIMLGVYLELQSGETTVFFHALKTVSKYKVLPVMIIIIMIVHTVMILRTNASSPLSSYRGNLYPLFLNKVFGDIKCRYQNIKGQWFQSTIF